MQFLLISQVNPFKYAWLLANKFTSDYICSIDTFKEFDLATYIIASLTSEDLGKDLNSNLLSLELEKVVWNNPLQNNVQLHVDICWIYIAELSVNKYIKTLIFLTTLEDTLALCYQNSVKPP